MIKAITRTIFNRLENLKFKFKSSGEEIKSTKVPGAIKQYGLPFTIITTRPSNK